MVENSKFHWSHTFYKGEKYEHLGEKIFKYSLVELEDSPIESGSKTTKALLDIFIGHGNDNGVAISYSNSILKAYISKVMRKKLAVDTHLPYIDGKTIIREYEDIKDDMFYNDVTHTYYSQKSNDRTKYSSFIYENFSTVRQIENYLINKSTPNNIIVTATQYAYLKDGVYELRSGLWGFNIIRKPGTIFSSFFAWYSGGLLYAVAFDIQLII